MAEGEGEELGELDHGGRGEAELLHTEDVVVGIVPDCGIREFEAGSSAIHVGHEPILLKIAIGDQIHPNTYQTHGQAQP